MSQGSVNQDVDPATLAAALPGYDVGGVIGRGAWGVVLEGTHRQLGRRVAVKQLPRAFGADPAVRARFQSEAQLLATLDHPHIVPIFDYVERDGLCLLVMEWLPGGTVWDRFTAAGLRPEAACALVMATCAGLHAAHRRGVLHRDVKPENLIFNHEGVLKVTDFGIAKVITGHEAAATQAGEVLGTPAYMAPEQAQGLQVGPPCDVYATGTMLYELLAGKLPFPEETDAVVLLYRRVHDQPTPLRTAAPQVSQALADVTMRALATAPADRYQTAEEFGVAVGEAAAATWGAGWLDRAGIPLMAAGPIALAAERPSLAPAQSDSRSVHPTTAPKPQGVSANDRLPGDVVSVARVVDMPAAPRLKALAAAVLLLVTLALALVGIGQATLGAGRAPGTLTIAGKDPAAPGPLLVDLAAPVPVTVKGAVVAQKPTDVKLVVTAAGFKIAQSTGSLAAGTGGLAAGLDAKGASLIVPNASRAELQVLRDGTVVARQPFDLKPDRSFFLTVPGIAGPAVILFAIAYAESLLRTMRRGRGTLTGMVGTPAMGALAGIGMVITAWALLGTEPAIPGLVVVAATGAIAGVLAALAGRQSGRRRRLRRKAKRPA